MCILSWKNILRKGHGHYLSAKKMGKFCDYVWEIITQEVFFDLCIVVEVFNYAFNLLTLLVNSPQYKWGYKL